MKLLNNVSAIAVATMLASCGGGGGGSDTPSELPAGTAQGVAYDGPLANSTISVYDYSQGTKGKFLGSTVSDAVGNYSLSISHINSIILVEATKGQYPEESTGRSVQLTGGQKLQAVLQYSQGQSVDVQLTHHTTWSTCYAGYRMRDLGESPVNAIIKSNEVFTSLAAGIPITETRPVDVTKSESVTPVATASHKAGFIAAGISQLVQAIKTADGVTDADNVLYTSITYSQRVCADVLADGLMDGIGETSAGNPTGQLYLGNQALGQYVYRTRLGQEILNFANTENNKTSLLPADLLDLANNIALNDHGIFNGVAASGVDQVGPTIVSSVSDGHLVSGDNVSIAFDITDPLGVKSVSFFINGEFLANGLVGDVKALFNSELYDEGSLTLTVKALDQLDNESETDILLTVVNIGPGVKITSPTLTNNTTYLASGTFTENAADITSIVVGGETAEINIDNGTWEATINAIGGESTLEAVITDSLGNTKTDSVTLRIDIIDPVINSWGRSVSFTNYDGLWNQCEDGTLDGETSPTRPLCLNAESVTLDGKEISGSLVNDDYILLAVDIADPQGQGVFSNVRDISLEYQVKLNGDVTVEWAPIPRPEPDYRIVNLPVTTEFFGNEFYLVSQTDEFLVTIKATDAAGNSDTVDFTFTLDVLTKALIVSTTTSGTLYERTFDDRTSVDGSKISLTHAFENDSKFDYWMKLEPGANHSVDQLVDSAFKETRERKTTPNTWRWQHYTVINPGDITYHDEYSYVDTLYGATSWENAGNPAYYVTLTKPQEEITEWETVLQPAPETLDWVLTSAGAPILTVNILGTIIKTSLVKLSPGNGTVVDYLLLHALTESTGYSVETAEGYPRQVTSQLNNTYNFNSEKSTYQVINKTLGIEIFPISDGWFHIPRNTNIEIRQTFEAPEVTYYTDEGVVSEVDYGPELFLDNTINWNMDTSLNITQAIYTTGSPDDIDNVSHMESLHGQGIVTHSIER